jgi:hypothetical protein
MMDGHGIFDAAALVQDGYPEELVSSATEYHKSGSDSGTIFNDEEALSGVTGVYGLDMLRKLADLVGADQSEANQYMGRGRIARALQTAIEHALDNEPDDRQFDV